MPEADADAQLGRGTRATHGTGALTGVRVVDLSHMLSGPYCSMLLADHGADVVKLEPLGGDGARRFGPFPSVDGASEWGYGGYFQSVNRGKRSIAVDLKDPLGVDLARRLIAGADVVIENFRPGVMERLGLSYESLAAENEGLIYAAIRGFGDRRSGEGPRSDLPAFDLTAQAVGGFMGITGPPGLPTKAGPGIGDIFPAVLCSFGVVAALHHRDRTGKGQYLDVAMYDAMVALCERIVYQHSYTGVAPQPQGNVHPLLCVYGVFRARDGMVTIAAPEDAQARRLFDAMGCPELADDERFATAAARIANVETVNALVESWTSTRSTSEVLAALEGIVPVGVVQDAADIANDPQVHARDMVVEVEHPGSGSVAVAGVPVKLTSSPGSVRGRAPLLGEHTREVLAEAGYAPDEVDALLRRGTIGAVPVDER